MSTNGKIQKSDKLWNEEFPNQPNGGPDVDSPPDYEAGRAMYGPNGGAQRPQSPADYDPSEFGHQHNEFGHQTNYDDT